MRGKSPATFHESFAVQLNDTHPSIAVPELMRLLVDEYLLDWDRAWDITRKTFSYTNHTLLPEALEKWPLPMFAAILPRHLARLSLIDEHDNKYVRMANLATVGSHAVNGVAELHSQLLKTTVLHDFFELSPQKFVSITNGVTPRRWVALANPDLAQLITDRIGEAWLIDGEELRKVEPLAEDPAFRQQWHRIKQTRKVELAGVIQRCTGIVVDPTSLFDVQVKRIHEYKRQLLNLLHVMTLYNRIRKDPGIDIIPRTVIFGGKAAPGYQMARLIIKLINCVGDIVNRDPVMAKRLKVVFFPNFNVTNAQLIYPAADLSEQISTAGTEASGTGNMKFALNGALTIGTFDGANIEIREQVGADNFFLFGLTVDRILQLRAGIYDPRRYYEEDSELREVVDQLSSGAFSGGDKELFKTIVHSLLNRDEYLLFADFRSYLERQADVDKAYRDREHWNRMSILNVARIGKCSSDRSVREYCAKIWDVTPARILRRCGTARRAAGT
jgi:starch phosphorylase